MDRPGNVYQARHSGEHSLPDGAPRPHEGRFLDTSKAGSYRLGAAFVIYDRLIRLTDPLVRAGSGVLHDLVVQARIPCVGLLARVCNDTVMCIATRLPAAWNCLELRTRSSHAVDARRDIESHSCAIAGSRTQKAFGQQYSGRASFRVGYSRVAAFSCGIKSQGFCITRGEIDPGAIGIAAPIVVPEILLSASVGLSVAAAATVDTELERRLALLVVSSAALVADILKPAEDNSGGQAKTSTN